MNKEKDTLLKYLVYPAIVGLILIFVSQFILNSQNKSDLVITNIAYANQAWPGAPFSFNVEVHNQGKITANDCYVYLDDNINGFQRESRSEIFSLPPTQDQQLTIKNGTYGKEGNYSIQAYASCVDHSLSKAEIRSISVKEP